MNPIPVNAYARSELHNIEGQVKKHDGGKVLVMTDEHQVFAFDYQDLKPIDRPHYWSTTLDEAEIL